MWWRRAGGAASHAEAGRPAAAACGLALSIWGCLAGGGGFAADLLPHVDGAMLRPGFWAERVADPDAIMMDREAIDRLSARVYKDGHRIHPWYEHDRVPGKRVRGYLEAQLEDLRHWYKYDRDNNRVRDPEFSDLMQEKLGLDGIAGTVEVRYGLTVRKTPVRVMPTDMLLQRKPNEPDFDILQSAVLEAGQPVAGYHRSRDGKWEYVQTAVCRGWVERARVGWTRDKGEIEAHLTRAPFLVVTGKEVEVFSDRRMEKKCGTMAMGARIPLVRRESGRFAVGVAERGAEGNLESGIAYLRMDAEVSEGYLDLTARNLADQAFKLLEEPYGWGGTDNQWDCSRFIMNVFATFGLDLPRTSFLQVRAFGGREFSRSPGARGGELDSLPALGALLEFPGHIGLYLGKANGRHYVIHSLGAYHVREDGRDVEMKVKRVVVSDLSLGEGGKRGSLFGSAQAAAVIR